ncbi:MAG TPA: FHA domain-containing protein [Micromonosporaceae bacterium]|nr:FHA domain-containing protein [Micromonosporaceae bacterium]
MGSDQTGTARAAAGLDVSCGAAHARLSPDQTVVIGRDSDCGLVVDDPLVSRQHAKVSWVDGGWVLDDLDSTNGTWIGGEQISAAPLADGTVARLGNADGPAVEFGFVHTHPPVPAPREPEDEPPMTALAVAGRTLAGEHDADQGIRIGRTPDNHIVVDDLLVSRHHAEIRRAGDGYQVVDLGSRNGTYVNGQQVPRAALHPGDLLVIGRHQFVFDGQRLQEYVDTGPVSLTADGLTVRLGKQILLSDVTFGLTEGSLLAVIGPSGCGKSTLLRAMTGIRPATEGRVHYDGRDLYAHYAELRYRIGLVPQDDVLHRQLTVRRALRFAASLRFADDVPRKERHARVEEVLATLGLADRAKQRIDTLSGGQRKRTSVALELLTEPSMLYLDEPTSGLDPALDREVMQELREMANSGRTVVCVTHSVLHLDDCDRVLVMCPGGTVGYFGPPDGVLDFFSAGDYADVFEMVTDSPEDWTRRYRDSELYQQYCGSVAASARVGSAAPLVSPAPPAGPLVSAPEQAAPVEPAVLVEPGAPAIGRAKVANANLRGLPLRKRALHPAAPIRQYITLCRRMLSVIVADRGYALFLLGLPLALALLTHSVPGNDGLKPPANPLLIGHSLEAQRLLVVLIVGAAFLGIAPAIREIVSESTIYSRERAVGLSPGAYLASKLTVFAVVNSVQVALFVWLSLLGRGAPKEALVLGSPTGEVIVAVALVALTSTVMGLFISALVRTTEQTTPVLVVLVMAQLVLSGGLFELQGEAVLNQISWLAQTRWGFAAGASTVDLLRLSPVEDSLWQHTAGAWWRSIGLLALHGAVLTAAARLALLRHEPGRQ